MSIPFSDKAKISLVDGRFRVVRNDKQKTVFYPEVQVLKNRIRVGCITVTKEVARKLLASPEGFVQAYDGPNKE